MRASATWVVLVTAGCECGSPSAMEPTWADAGEPRAYDACDLGRERPRPDITAFMTGCASHEECTEGPNGRCIRAGPHEHVCTYDECETTADCPSGSRCACNVGPALQNLCLRDDCTECGELGCDVSYGCSGPGELEYSATRFACHTPDDTCNSDADCGEREFCTRGPLTGGDVLPHWRCEVQSCAP